MKLLSLLTMFVFVTCQNNIKISDKIDGVIAKYDKEDFSYFNNIFIAIRNAGFNEITYIIHKSEGDLPVYFVKYTKINGKMEINRTLFEKAKKKDYFTNAKIKEIIENFRKYDLLLLQVDKSGNVYMNPFRSNEPAKLLRLAHPSNQKEIRKGFVYKHYKNQWYIRK